MFSVSLAEVSGTYQSWLETELRSLLAMPDAGWAPHYGMMQYHMGWLDAEFRPVQAPAGKRIRPLLCLLACAAAGGEPRNAVPAAIGLELLHNFSLIHDDIEDDSPTRRHRPTVWKVFGMPQACNAGDGMFSLAHLAFHRLLERDVPAAAVLAALRIFDETCVALTEGQYLDMSFETRLSVSVDEYLSMSAGKTGALLAAAPQIGATVAGADAGVVETYRQFGAALGRAFQLQDDILGIWGDEAVTGKSAASDILAKKKTLPVLYAMTRDQVGTELAARYAGPAFTPHDVPAILALLEAADARAYVTARVNEAADEAHRMLQRVSSHAEPAHHVILGELLDRLVVRRS